MFHFLGLLFIIIIAFVLIGISIIGTVVRSILGLGRRRSSSTSGTYQDRERGYRTDGYSDYDRKQANGGQQDDSFSEEGEPRPRHKKLFSKDEGEYVDFEEIEE